MNNSEKDQLKNFPEIPYDQLEKMNLEAVEKAKKASPETSAGKYIGIPRERKANQGSDDLLFGYRREAPYA